MNSYKKEIVVDAQKLERMKVEVCLENKVIL